MIKFSVIIPVFNAENTIIPTIASCLDQSFQPYEILIIDDCSSDNSIKRIKESFSDNRIKIIAFEKNRGVAAARNRGWDISSGDYIAFLDSDDIWHKEKLRILNEAVLQYGLKCVGHCHTDNALVFNRLQENNKITLLRFGNFLLRNYFNTSCLAIKKDISFRFNTAMRFTEDHELLIRISAAFPVGFIKSHLTLLGRPQLSKGGLSGNKLRMRLGEMRMYFVAVKQKKILFPFLPFLIIYSCFKYLIKIFR